MLKDDAASATEYRYANANSVNADGEDDEDANLTFRLKRVKWPSRTNTRLRGKRRKSSLQKSRASTRIKSTMHLANATYATARSLYLTNIALVCANRARTIYLATHEKKLMTKKNRV